MVFLYLSSGRLNHISALSVSFRIANATEEYCSDINSRSNSSVYVNIIEPEVAQYKVYKSYVQCLLPMVLSFYFGPWSDT